MPQWPHGQSSFFKAVKHCTDRLTLPSNLYLEINFIENNEVGGGCIGPDTTHGTKPQEQEAWEFERTTMISFLEEHGTIGTN